MKAVNFQSLLLALLCVAGLASGQFFQENGQGFLSAGCTNWYAPHDSMVLTATCPDQVCGKMVTSRLKLNDCLENVNGNLYWNSTGYFYDTCRYCTIQGDRYMTCHCRTNDRDEKIGLVDLNMGIITNYYGYLSCFGKVDFALSGTHNWPCKGKGWTPWGSGSSKLDLNGGPFVPEAALPERTLFPAFEFTAANTTAITNTTAAINTVPTSA